MLLALSHARRAITEVVRPALLSSSRTPAMAPLPLSAPYRSSSGRPCLLPGGGGSAAQMRTTRARPPNIGGRQHVKPYSSNSVLLATFCSSCWVPCPSSVPARARKHYAFKCSHCIIYLSILKYMLMNSAQLYTHSWWVLSCHWGEVTVFTMTRLPGPKRVLPNSPHS